MPIGAVTMARVRALACDMTFGSDVPVAVVSTELMVEGSLVIRFGLEVFQFGAGVCGSQCVSITGTAAPQP